MEQINFDSSKQFIQNLKNQNVSSENLQTQNTNRKFEELLCDVSNSQLDLKARNIIKSLAQKYHVNITVTPNETDKNAIYEGQFSVEEDSGYNNSVVIPHNLLNKMATDPKVMKSVEYAIRSDIDVFNEGKTFRAITGDRSTSSPLTFNEDGTWEKWGMTSSTSDNFNLDSKKIKIIQSEQEELKLIQQKLYNKDLDKTTLNTGVVNNQQSLRKLLNIETLNRTINSYSNGFNNLNYYNSVSLVQKKYSKVHK